MNINQTAIQKVESNMINTSEKSVACEIKSAHYAHIPQLFTEDTLQSASWQSFKKSWLNLMLDNYMNDNGKYRYRRFAVFNYSDLNKCIYVEPKQPYYQALYHNTLNGGIPRHYEQFEEHILHNAVFRNILYYLVDVCTELQGPDDWFIEAHQMHIHCTKNMTGKPSPEGIHRDGRDFVFIVFIDRKNISGGQTTVLDLNKIPLTHVTMLQESETLFLDDEKLFHGVSELELDQEADCGYRNVLVIAFLSKAKVNEVIKKPLNL
ncbi:unnamed protein product [Rotaria socialis]|uniref:2OG-Fe dioxygenase family protein n=1 Tax=Rotaria socialis TaxID=392032 RepID=A0A817RM11_9BILA|nr:unnamed protein product [Rotaria socialis]CAF3382403.1 unnamed protein product [Rotaria socialis]CAF4121216.1 unnamed protein product [Rotaria socialis]CAF4250467.1 unnamed protein product [Rotaria socialis]